MIGRAISHYRILDTLGAGGMGVVYLAEDGRLGRQVALKFLPPEATRDETTLERFRLEARAASSLSHPGICTVFDIGDDGGSPFIVMEALKGETAQDQTDGGVGLHRHPPRAEADQGGDAHEPAEQHQEADAGYDRAQHLGEQHRGRSLIGQS